MSWRKLIIGGHEWRYRVGSDNVVARAPDGTKLVEQAWVVAGTSHDDWQRGRRKGYSHVRPSEVAAWLAANLGVDS